EATQKMSKDRCAPLAHSFSMSLSLSLSPSLLSERSCGTRPVIKSPSEGGGLSLASFSSCLRLNSSVRRKKTTAPNTHIKPHGTPAYTKTNTAAGAHAAAITAHAILKYLNMSILYLQSSQKSSYFMPWLRDYSNNSLKN